MTSFGDKKRSVKANLVKRAFAEATKNIILEDGVESVSIRKVADLAGYTFATIYNHFRNEDELLRSTRNMMINDIVAYMDIPKKKDPAGIKDVQELFGRYLDYFITYPNVFRFFYFRHLEDADKPEERHIPGGDQVVKTFEFLTATGCYTPEEVETLIHTLIYCAHGLLTLSISDNDELSILDIKPRMEKVIELLLRDLKEKSKEEKP